MERIIAPNTVTAEAADVAPATGTPGYATDGDPVAGKSATLWPAYQYNAIQEELMAVIEGADLIPDRDDNTQLLQAIQKLSIMVLPSAPSSQLTNTIFVEDREQILRWKTIGAYTGYVSPDVGRFTWGTTDTPRPFEVDLVGQTIDRADPKYAALHAWATASSRFIAAASWAAGTYFFAEMGGTLFKVPDMRDMFLRATGTDIDTANARLLGSAQSDSFKAHIHTTWPTGQVIADMGGTGGNIQSNLSAGEAWKTNALLTNGGGGAETRGANTALHPRILL